MLYIFSVSNIDPLVWFVCFCRCYIMIGFFRLNTTNIKLKMSTFVMDVYAFFSQMVFWGSTLGDCHNG